MVSAPLPGATIPIGNKPGRNVHGRAWPAVVGSTVVFWVVAGSAVAVSGRAAVLAAVAGVGLAAAARARSRSRARRRRYAQRAAAEDLLATFAEELEAGGAPTVAFASAASGSSSASASVSRGTRTTPPMAADEVTEALRSSDVPTLRQLSAGWQVSTGTGIRLAPVAARLSAGARAAGARDRELRAALAGPRASGRLVACLPVAAAGLGASVGASPHRVLLDSGAGLACLVVGILSDLAGLAWMNRIADRVEHDCDGSHTLRGDPALHSAHGRIATGRITAIVDHAGSRHRSAPHGRKAGLVAESNIDRFDRRVNTAGMIVVAVMVAAAVVLVATRAGHLVVPMVGVCATGSAVAVLARMRSDPARIHHARLVADLPIALDLIAACLAAGAAPGSAQQAVGDAVGGPLGTELARAAVALRSGRTPREAYRRLVAASRAPSPLARLSGRIPARTGPPAPGVVALVEALARSDTSGARLATTLERIADRTRDEAHAKAIEAARRAGVLAAAPLGLCFLPAFILLGVCPVILAAAPGLLGG
jgi:tight adherence protein B